MPKRDRDVILSHHHRKPAITWDDMHASRTSRPAIHPNVHQSIIQAIQHKNFVTLVMHSHEVSGEPHVYGMRGGKPMLLVFNTETDPQWQMADVEEVEQVKIWLDEHFTKRELPAQFDPDKENRGNAGE